MEYQPVVLKGEGEINFGEHVSFGVINSPFYLNSYCYIEARSKKASIFFGNNIHINNAVSIVSEKKIIIKDNVLIGHSCTIMDSNFHDLTANNRTSTDPDPQEVIIGRNVFIGNKVTVLKGVVLGENTVVAACSVVTKSFPSNVVIGGNPAKIINTLA
ncbi:acyltransferase [Tamlana sp. s12]|nr:hypothetical protein VQ01_08920 [Tamlana sp. s12]QQY83989.1 acyltransferase [Tamlana sp. s12]